MKFFRYFKGHSKKGRWHAVELGSQEEKTAFQDKEYGFCTVLAVGSGSDDPDKLEGDLYYTGPFYIDIDTDGDLRKSITAAKHTLKKLREHGVPEQSIDIWLSGKKGFHFTVPQAIFGTAVGIRDLPHVYRALARTFGLDKIDWSVYSRGKGRMWRLPSRQRVDNDQYKVIIAPEELVNLTVEQYREMCSQPSRPVDEAYINGATYPRLSTLFNFSVGKAKEEKPPVVTLIDDNMRGVLGEDLMPQCAIDLKNGENVRNNRGFNERSVQMMKAVRAFVPGPAQKETLEEFAINATGESYGSPESRLDHVRRSFGSVASGTDYVWSCRSILSVLERAPCDNCPLSFLRWQQEEKEDEEIQRKQSVPVTAVTADSTAEQVLTDAAQSLIDNSGAGIPPAPPQPPQAPSGGRPPRRTSGRHAPSSVDDTSENLTIHDNCYVFIAQGGGMRRVTNFVINITKVYIEYIPNLAEDRRVAVQAEVYVGGKYAGTVNIEEGAWNSNAGFTGSFDGIGNITFYGKDEDAKRMKSSLLKDIEKRAVNIRRVHSYGVHYNEVAGQDVFTFVEPNWSIDNFGQENLYMLSGRMSGAPSLQHIMPLIPGEGDKETTQCLTELISINQKETVSLLLGWTMASFFKQHIFAYTNEFPLLSLWGNAQAGKTQTSGLFAALHGIHYVGGDSNKAGPISLGGSGASTFAMWTSMAESMTVPKLFEEYNQRTLKNKYEEYSEHFKKAFNQHPIKRGTIRNAKTHGSGPIDAHTIDIPMTAPTMIMSEQSIQIPALVQRCIQIQMNEDQRRGPGMEQAFVALKDHYTYLDRFAKTAYIEVINTPVSKVKEWIASWRSKIPTMIGDRPHFSFCVCLAGLSFLKELDEKYALGMADKIDDLIRVMIEDTNTSSSEIARRKSHSEVDRLMNEFAAMAELSSKEGGMQWLVKGQYYLRDNKFLYLDGFAAHAQYTRFAVTMQQPPIIQTYAQFKELVRHSRYCETVSATVENFARGRPVMKFSIAAMAEKGIEVESFISS